MKIEKEQIIIKFKDGEPIPRDSQYLTSMVDENIIKESRTTYHYFLVERYKKI